MDTYTYTQRKEIEMGILWCKMAKYGVVEIPWLFPYYVCFRIPTAQLAIKHKRQCDIVCTMVSQQTQRVLRVGFTIESTCLVSFTQF